MPETLPDIRPGQSAIFTDDVMECINVAIRAGQQDLLGMGDIDILCESGVGIRFEVSQVLGDNVVFQQICRLDGQEMRATVEIPLDIAVRAIAEAQAINDELVQDSQSLIPNP